MGLMIAEGCLQGAVWIWGWGGGAIAAASGSFFIISLKAQSKGDVAQLIHFGVLLFFSPSCSITACSFIEEKDMQLCNAAV